MRLFILLSFLAFSDFISAQDNFAYIQPSHTMTFKIDETKYPGKILTVLSDKDFIKYTNPHYRAYKNKDGVQLTISKPVAYVSGSKVKIQSVFRFEECIGKVCKTSPVIFIKGIGTDDAIGYDFELAAVSFFQIPQNAYTYERECVKEFVTGKVDFFEKFSIDWFVSADAINWVLAGKSTNTLYVVKNKPLLDYYRGHPFYMESVFYNACKYAKGITEDKKIVTKMIVHFSLKSVHRADQKPMTYYGEWGTRVTTSSGLCSTSDGQCESWASFFLDCLRIHGLVQEPNTVNSGERIGILLKAAYAQNKSVGFYTKNNSDQNAWTFIGEPLEDDKYTNIWKGPPYCTYLEPYAKVDNKWNYYWKEISNSEISSPGVTFSCPNSAQSPLTAQSNNCPKSNFGSHTFVLVNSIVFDPSYGVSYGTWEPSKEPIWNISVISTTFQKSINAFYTVQVGAFACEGTDLVWNVPNTNKINIELIKY